jgi:hypothetical protein
VSAHEPPDVDEIERRVRAEEELRVRERELPPSARQERHREDDADLAGELERDAEVLIEHRRYDAALIALRLRLRLERRHDSSGIALAALALAKLLRQLGLEDEVSQLVGDVRSELGPREREQLARELALVPPPEATTAAPEPPARWRHPKFGVGELVERTPSGLRLRFADGSVRVLAEDRVEQV